jgi:hypothetical protein
MDWPPLSSFWCLRLRLLMKWWRGLLSSLEQLVEVAVCSAYHHTHSRIFHHKN